MSTSKEMRLLGGVVPPVSTPFTSDYGIDEKSLQSLIRHLLAGGVHGLFALGSTSEVAFLTDRNRDEVLRITMDEVKGQVPVVAGVIDMTPLRINEHVKRAKAAGVEGIVVTAPFFTRTHPAEIEKHFRLIKEACGDLHLYAYDIPVAVNGVKLDAEMMLRLGAEGVISGVKDSSGNDAGIRSLVIGKRERKIKNFVVMTGSELGVDSALAFGADGVVPGIGNVDPAGYVRIYDAVKRGDFAAAQSEQDRLIQMFDLIFVGAHRMSVASSALGAFKASLKLLGIIDDALMAPPYLPLNEDEIEKIKPFLIKAGLLK